MVILAIDSATRTGMALGKAGHKPRAWASRLKSPSDPVDTAWANIGFTLRDLFQVERPDLIAIEAPMHPAGQKSPDAVVLQWGVIAVVVFIAKAYEIRLEKVNAQTVSKHFTGKARWSAAEGGRQAKKQAAVSRCHLLGYMPKDRHDEDQADALALWDYSCAKWARLAPQPLHLFGETA